MSDKSIISEINRFKLLSGYDSNNTLTENIIRINEVTSAQLGRIFKNMTTAAVERELERVATNFKLYQKEAGNAAGREIIGSPTTVASIAATDFRNLTNASLKTISQDIMNNSKNVALRDSLINKYVTTPRVIESFNAVSKKEAYGELISKGYTNDTAKRILSRFEAAGGEFGAVGGAAASTVKSDTKELMRLINADPTTNKLFAQAVKDGKKPQLESFIKANLESGKSVETVRKDVVKQIRQTATGESKQWGTKLMKMADKITQLKLRHIAYILIGGALLGLWTFTDVYHKIKSMLGFGGDSDEGGDATPDLSNDGGVPADDEDINDSKFPPCVSSRKLTVVSDNEVSFVNSSDNSVVTLNINGTYKSNDGESGNWGCANDRDINLSATTASNNTEWTNTFPECVKNYTKNNVLKLFYTEYENDSQYYVLFTNKQMGNGNYQGYLRPKTNLKDNSADKSIFYSCNGDSVEYNENAMPNNPYEDLRDVEVG